MPGGTVSLLGTTSSRVDDLERVGPTVAEVDRNIREGAAMIPALAQARYIGAFSRVRPLLQAGAGARPGGHPGVCLAGPPGAGSWELLHHHRRQADHLPPDGRKSGRSGGAAPGQPSAMSHRASPPTR